MNAESNNQSKRGVERRKHPRSDSSLRYRRFRYEIEPPRALVAASEALFNWIGRVKGMVLAGARGLRRFPTNLIHRQRKTRHSL